jgi:hypothetical protein
MKKKSSKIDKDLIKAKSILQLILDDKEQKIFKQNFSVKHAHTNKI